MEDSSFLFWSMLFGAIGVGYFLYGKKQKSVVPLFIGIGLFIFPYFISNMYILIATGVALVITPFFVKA
ncbi:hypothetical protein [Thiomicrorhabdus sp. Milos-T2]|uniref:hypothetical protein n=1 Tax=Thiomicrorhabdus sp. Milos-T2 TaxID=90814 RepID=UPI000494A7BF|nr:hypothetical protein [Thiomicrorhabdus sp. Milos-T2]